MEKGNSGFFRGVKPEDLLKKKDAMEKVKDVINNLTKYNVWVEAAVEVLENGYLAIKDTQVNEY